MHMAAVASKKGMRWCASSHLYSRIAATIKVSLTSIKVTTKWRDV